MTDGLWPSTLCIGCGTVDTETDPGGRLTYSMNDPETKEEVFLVDVPICGSCREKFSSLERGNVEADIYQRLRRAWGRLRVNVGNQLLQMKVPPPPPFDWFSLVLKKEV